MTLIKEIYVQIEPFKTRRAGKLFWGMKQKSWHFCCALIHRFGFVSMSLTTVGLQFPRKEFWDCLSA